MKGTKKISLLLLTGIFTFAFNVRPVVAVDWWPMFHHDLNHTGYSTSTAPDTNNVLWSYQTGGGVYSSPAVIDGRVYVGSDDCNVYCLNASTGAKIWNYTTGGAVHSSPAVADGNVYVGSLDNKVYCLPVNDPNGDGVIDSNEVMWVYTTGGGVESSPTVVDGNVYVGSGDARVYCLPANDPNGDGIIDPCEVIWSYQTNRYVDVSPAVVDGNVYVGSDKFYCLDASTGEKVWTYTVPGGGGVESSSVVADGKVYVSVWAGVDCLPADDPNGDGVIDPTSERIWAFRAAADVFHSSPAVAYGKVYVQSSSGWVFCLPANDPNGDGFIDWNEVKWKYVTSGGWAMYASSSAAVADGKVYIGSQHRPTGGGSVYCLPADDPNGDGTIDESELIWSYQMGTAVDVESSPAVADGKVYVGADDGKVYCFGLGNLRLLSPNGGEALLAGTNFPIQWETLGTVSDVLIGYSTDDGLSWTEVDPCNTGNSGTYNWLVPILTSVRCLVHISDANDANDIDTSDHTFVICECQKAIAADLTHNCYVDWADLDKFTDQWPASDCCEPDWCEGADLDESNDVDWADFAIFASLWLECGNPFDPACVTPPPWQECWDWPTQCHGDVDGDGDAGMDDFFYLRDSWETSYGEPDYNPCADFSRDGRVNLIDLLEFIDWYAMVVPADCPPWVYIRPKSWSWPMQCHGDADGDEYVDELDILVLYPGVIYPLDPGSFTRRSLGTSYPDPNYNPRADFDRDGDVDDDDWDTVVYWSQHNPDSNCPAGGTWPPW